MITPEQLNDLAALQILTELREAGWAFMITVRGIKRGGIFLGFDHSSGGNIYTSEGDTLLEVMQDAARQIALS